MNYSLSGLCKCSASGICPFCIELTLSVIAMLLGIFFIWQPKRIIEAQIAIYRPFNWKIEPVSMEKEIRNTRLMGVAVLIVGVISLISMIMASRVY
ncbi:MAG: hypothetical protein A2Z72_01825 [Omnitrophica bacterium RBG_13_46_9]|nr:MAG: hypothetical protein A2Z72_01825 [Omnitrophica bacterium RBG_13_46_9]